MQRCPQIAPRRRQKKARRRGETRRKSLSANSRSGARTRTSLNGTQDFKSCASANSATRPEVSVLAVKEPVENARFGVGRGGMTPSGKTHVATLELLRNRANRRRGQHLLLLFGPH